MKIGQPSLNLSAVISALGMCMLISGCNSDNWEDQEYVKITAKDQYYEVTINYADADDYFVVGQEYGQKTLKAVSNYEKLLDSYLVDEVAWLQEAFKMPDNTYEILIERAREIKKQVDSNYVKEMDGFASVLSGGVANVLGDGKVSEDEFAVFNLNPDIATADACSALAVYGNSSSSGQTIVGRNMDWYPGEKGQMGQLNAVVHAKSKPYPYFSVSYLGMIGAGTGINSTGLYIANLYSPIGAAYSAVGKRSVMMDIRKGLETLNTLSAANTFFADSQKLYAYHHLMFLADRTVAKVLENDFERKRALRTDQSTLNTGITWGYTNAVAAVNAFMLKGNFDNFHDYVPGSFDPDSTDAGNFNTDRWENFRTQLALQGNLVSFDSIRTIMAYHKAGAKGMDNGDIYNAFTTESIVYSFSDNRLEAFLLPKSGEFVDQPVYVAIPMPFKP